MNPHTSILLTLAVAFATAFVLGVVASRVGLPPLVGYLLAGIVIGPHSLWFVGDVALATGALALVRDLRGAPPPDHD